MKTVDITEHKLFFRHIRIVYFSGHPKSRDEGNGMMIWERRMMASIENNQDEALQIRHMKVDLYESKKGRALRLRDDDNTYLIIFQRPNILETWHTRAQQVEKSSHVDASDEQLTLIPEQILSNEAQIQILNLRRNSLISRPPTEKSMAPIGYIDDLYRVHSLQVIDLSANQILSFPIQLTLLSHLRQLNLSSNYISLVPNECSNMRRLQFLNLSNNQLDSLPDSIRDLLNLQVLDISFNQFSQIPNCIHYLPLDMWRLAGNNIESIKSIAELTVEKIDLRRNVLSTSFRLEFTNVTHLDLRDNSMIATIHLTNLRFLKFWTLLSSCLFLITSRLYPCLSITFRTYPIGFQTAQTYLFYE
uniref:Leucine Rich repeat-containing domain protein n=1 Tax=Caenorhabditis tropicalis TaxID=1561998 RepID=A0A1I7TT54_9PELO